MNTLLDQFRNTGDGPAPWALIAALVLSFAGAVGIALYGPLVGALVVGGIAAVFLVRHPFLLLNAVAVFAVLEQLGTIRESPVYTITGVKLVGYLLVVSLLFDLAVHRSRLKIDMPNVLLGALGVLIVASITVAASPALAIAEALRFGQLVVLFLAARHLVDSFEKLKVLAITIVVSMGFSALIGIYFYETGTDARVTGISQNAALLSADLLIALALGGALLMTSRGLRTRLLWLSIIVVFVVAIYGTFTRAAFLALLFGFLGVVLAVPRPKILVPFASLLLLLGVVFSGSILDQIERTVYIGDNSTRQHLLTLEAGVRMTFDYPLLGVGYGNYEVHYLNYSHDIRGLPKTAHNTYLAISSEAGILALILFLGFTLTAIARPFFASLKIYRSDTIRVFGPWALSLLFIMLALALFSAFHTLRTSKLLWIVLALAVEIPTLCRLYLEKQAESECCSEPPSSSSSLSQP